MKENEIELLDQQLDLTIAEDGIKEMEARYMALSVNGVHDNVGHAAVHEARLTVKRKRTEIEKRRKELNESAITWQRTVNAEAKRLTAMLLPIEAYLTDQEAIVTREKERLKQLEQERKQKMIDARLTMLKDLGVVALVSDVADLTPEGWESMLAGYTELYRAKQQQLAAEEAERKRVADVQQAAAAELAAERAELEQLRAKLEAQQRAAAKEQAQQAAAAEAEATARRQAKEAEREAARIAASQPDADKLLDVANAVCGIEVPTLTEANANAAETVRIILMQAGKAIASGASKLVKPK